MKRICRNRRLTPEETEKHKEVREAIAKELPDLVARHYDRAAPEITSIPANPGDNPNNDHRQ